MRLQIQETDPFTGAMRARYLRLLDKGTVTQMSVATRCGVPQSTLSTWLRGKSELRLSALDRLYQHLVRIEDEKELL